MSATRRALCATLFLSVLALSACGAEDDDGQGLGNPDPNPEADANPDPMPEPEPEPEPDPQPDPGPSPIDVCEELEARYDAVLANGSACNRHTDCQVLNGQCGVGLGGCYASVNSSVTQDELSVLGQEFQDGGCTEGVCDCDVPRPAVCVDGRCGFGEDCGGRMLGESFEDEDGCNTCTCTPDGIACTDRVCLACDDLEGEYAALVADNKACEAHEDCQLLNGQCGVGLGGCYEAVNLDLEQGALGALAQSYSEGGCTGAVCDCAEPPTVICDGGSCEFGPFCNGFELGESFPAGDGCNTCICDEGGISCTEQECDACTLIENEYADLVQGNRTCDVVEDCQVLNGQCGVGLGGCYEFVNQNVTQADLGALGGEFGAAECTRAVCDCAEAPPVVCDAGLCGPATN